MSSSLAAPALLPAVALVRYGRLRHLAEFVPADGVRPRAGEACVVSTPRGVELGEVVTLLERAPDGPGRGALLRAASDEDRARAGAFEARAAADLAAARAVNAPAARVIAVERLLDGERAVVYYTSEGRVAVPDWSRQLGRALEATALVHHLNARQRAKTTGGCGPCGRTLCCSSFLRRLEPVPMRLAELQGLALDPERTAGLCGRLKCCLRYEAPVYEEERRALPRLGWRVETARLSGVVVALDPLGGRLLVRPELGAPRRVFAAEVLRVEAPRRRLPVAGQEAPSPEPAVAPEAAAPDRTWSQLALRLWRRVRKGEAPAPEASEDRPDPELE